MSKLSEAPALTSPDTSATDTPRLRGGNPSDKFTLEYLTNPANIAAILHKTWDLSDDAFYDLIDDIGTRAARLVLRTKALEGDVKALDLYWRVTKEDRGRKRQADKKPDERSAQVQGELIQRPRAPLPVVSDSTITEHSE